ncbi:unnamed protein product [Sphenostylis stenocarpa]|uniref:Cytochrome b5 heme-binding domain-containing protein n=1 Tax=Sphenostylis stenocarpa TaxID=92480 RepID=A0AA86V523_9FABA|nr:unnamed protein product [Sphenostylis stenocarpa]
MGGDGDEERKVYTLAQVSEHNNSKDCWLIIDGKVYNVTKFLDDHPGGDDVLLSSTGKDATDDFEDVGHSKSARAMLVDLYVGDIDPATIPAKPKQTPPKPLQNNQNTSSNFLIKMLQFIVPLIVLGVAVVFCSLKFCLHKALSMPISALGLLVKFLKMGSIKREKRVLKLVHPGKHIEVHREPVRAEEVMKKNPRHCITRPDVFKFPWIVVKPESVLLPGSVFLIVPNHTIYDLLKATTSQSISFQSQEQSPFSQQNQRLKQDYHDSSYNGINSKPQMHNQNIRLSFLSPISQRNSNIVSETLSQDMENVCTYRERSQNQSHFEIWPKVASYEENSQKRMELIDASTFEFRPYFKALKYYEKYYSMDMRTEMQDLKKNDVNIEFVSSEQVTLLKSCLRRPNSMRKKLKLKVSFNIQIKNQ